MAILLLQIFNNKYLKGKNEVFVKKISGQLLKHCK